MLKLRILFLTGLAAVLVCPGFAQSPGQSQGPARPVAPMQTGPRTAFRAVNYEVRASLDVIGRVISSQAKVEFAANEASRELEVELNQNLRVNGVRDGAGKPVLYDRDENTPLRLKVTLPDSVPAGGKVTLQFDYAGPLATNVRNPDQNAHLAYIGKDGAFLLLPSRWFPLTDYPTNRYTGTFQIEVPGTMVVVGTGTSTGAPVSVTPRAVPPTGPLGNARSAAPVSPAAAPPPPSMENERMLYTYRVDKPQAAGTFVAAPLQLNPVRAQGMSFSVYAPAAVSNTAQSYADTLAQILDFYNGEFGALPDPSLKIAQIPDDNVPGFSAPGLLLVSARQWTAQPNVRLLANLVAQQWWGNQVTAASASDVWVTAGLARYSEGLYVEQASGKEALNKALEDFAVGALMFDDAAPIADAKRLEPESEEYRSVVTNKGAMVFHMLRAQLGDANFSALLKDFYSRFAGKPARIEDFEKLAEAHAAQPATQEVRAIGNSAPAATTEAVNLRPFFTQWLRSTGVPEFSLEYVTYRTKKGFRIVGKVKQNLDFFRMDVEMEVQTEGNPEFKTVSIAGKESSFTVETFGRPKPNGIILDPHNFILKSSQRLRVRGIIARGESLAELGRYYDAVQQYQRALELDRTNALAEFRMGEAFFYQRNYAASAQSFRDTLDGSTDSTTRWTEVWSHIYLGRIYDIQGDRTRAVNEYSKAKQTADDTGGAQAEVEKSLKKAYTEVTG
jgi:hypothetical protein